MSEFNDIFARGIHAKTDGNLNAAIAAFQQTKADPALAAASLNLLGQCCLDKRWHDEAIDAFTAALERGKLSDALRLELYARLQHALDERDRASAARR